MLHNCSKNFDKLEKLTVVVFISVISLSLGTGCKNKDLQQTTIPTVETAQQKALPPETQQKRVDAKPIEIADFRSTQIPLPTKEQLFHYEDAMRARNRKNYDKASKILAVLAVSEPQTAIVEAAKVEHLNILSLTGNYEKVVSTYKMYQEKGPFLSPFHVNVVFFSWFYLSAGVTFGNLSPLNTVRSYLNNPYPHPNLLNFYSHFIEIASEPPIDNTSQEEWWTRPDSRWNGDKKISRILDFNSSIKWASDAFKETNISYADISSTTKPRYREAGRRPTLTTIAINSAANAPDGLNDANALLVNALIEVNDYKNAQHVAESLFNKNQESFFYMSLLGKIYKAQNNKEGYSSIKDKYLILRDKTVQNLNRAIRKKDSILKILNMLIPLMSLNDNVVTKNLFDLHIYGEHKTEEENDFIDKIRASIPYDGLFIRGIHPPI